MAWHKCSIYDLHVNDDGKVDFGTRTDAYGNDVRVNVYKSYAGITGYLNVSGELSLKTVRNGIYEGTIRMV